MTDSMCTVQRRGRPLQLFPGPVHAAQKVKWVFRRTDGHPELTSPLDNSITPPVRYISSQLGNFLDEINSIPVPSGSTQRC